MSKRTKRAKTPKKKIKNKKRKTGLMYWEDLAKRVIILYINFYN